MGNRATAGFSGDLLLQSALRFREKKSIVCMIFSKKNILFESFLAIRVVLHLNTEKITESIKYRFGMSVLLGRGSHLSMKNFLIRVWEHINPLPTDYEPIEDDEYFPEDDGDFLEDVSAFNRKDKKSTSSSLDEKLALVEMILRTKFRNLESAEEIVKIIDTCEYHEEKSRIVEAYIREFAQMPADLDDTLSDGFESQYRMERLSLTYISLLEALVKTSLQLGESPDSFADYFTRVVFAEPHSIFENETARSYALFRGTWLLHNRARSLLKDDMKY